MGSSAGMNEVSSSRPRGWRSEAWLASADAMVGYPMVDVREIEGEAEAAMAAALRHRLPTACAVVH
jgi:hypothetical protein